MVSAAEWPHCGQVRTDSRIGNDCMAWGLTFDMSAGQRARSGLWDVRSMEGLGLAFRWLMTWKTKPWHESEHYQHGEVDGTGDAVSAGPVLA